MQKSSKLQIALSDVVTWPKLGRGIIPVWKRNYLYFRYSFVVSLFWTVLEPLFYLGAIGYGLGAFISNIEGGSYVEFYFPALLSSTAMMISFFESTYGSFTKMTHQKTYQTILLAPISPSEILLGETLWCACKGFLGVLGVTLVAAGFGLVNTFWIIPALGVLFLQCWAFASFGLLVSSLARNYDSFIYATSGLIVPMSLISGTYFPLAHFPEWIQKLAYILPLTHGVAAVRNLLGGHPHWQVLLNVIYLIVFSMIILNWACARMTRKIIK